MIKHLTATLGLDKTGFDAGMAAAGKQVNKFGDDLKRSLAGAFGAAAVSVFVKQAIDFADRIKDLSDQTEISTSALQAMEYAAGQSGTTLESLVVAIKKIGQARNEALNDASGEFALSFERLGVSINQLKNERLETILQIISDRFKDAGDNQTLLADGIKIMGKNALEIFGTMKSGLSDLMAQAEKSGAVASTEAIENVARYKDQWVEAGQKIKAVFVEIVSAISAAHNSMADFLNRIGTRVDLVGRLLLGGDKDKLSIEGFLREYSMLADGRKGEVLFGRESGPNVGIPSGQIGLGFRSEQEKKESERLKKEAEDLKTLKNREEVLREMRATPEENLKFFQEKYAEIINRISSQFDVSNKDMQDLVDAEIEIERAKSRIKPEIEKTIDDFSSVSKKGFVEDTFLGRIGAFTGAAANASLPPGQQAQIQQLQKIYDAMVGKGIIVRDAR